MKHFYLIHFIFLIGLFCLSSCGDNCAGTTGEPTLRFSFINNTRPAYTQAYAIDGNNQRRGNIQLDENAQSYLLPLSTKEDQVTYIFERDNQPIDTLIVTYDRIFRFDDNLDCGLGLNLNNVALSPQSTFADNDFVIQQVSNDLYELNIIF